MAFTLTSALGVGAGVLILAVGLFVVVARKEGWLGWLFFALAILDGVSTILFQVSTATPGQASAFYQALYWYAYIGFVAMLAVFGIVFPLPWRGPRVSALLVALVAAVALVGLVAHGLDHDAFWMARLEADGSVVYSVNPAGNVVNGAFSLVVALLVAKLTRDMLAPPSDSHRRQAAFVLGGMAFAYAPYAVGTLARMLATRPDVLVAGRADRVFAYWAFVAVCVALVASVAALARQAGSRRLAETRFVLAAYAVVAVMAVLVWLIPTLAISRLVRILALLAYPVLLAWAIARYEVFDIDRRLRRAAAVTFAAVALTGSFVLAESALENLLASRLLGGLSSSVLSGTIAALATAAIFVPIVRTSRKAASKLVPELSADELTLRKREIYAHSLAGAMADGILKEGESRTLAMLRQSLGISEEEHRALLTQVAAG